MELIQIRNTETGATPTRHSRLLIHLIGVSTLGFVERYGHSLSDLLSDIPVQSECAPSTRYSGHSTGAETASETYSALSAVQRTT